MLILITVTEARTTSTSHPVNKSCSIISLDVSRHKKGLMHAAWVSQCRHFLCRPHKQLARTYNQLTECQWLESFPLHYTSQAGTRWFNVTRQVDNSTGTSGHCGPQVYWDPKSLHFRADWTWLSISRALFAVPLPTMKINNGNKIMEKKKTQARHATTGSWTVGLHHFLSKLAN